MREVSDDSAVARSHPAHLDTEWIERPHSDYLLNRFSQRTLEAET
jgi:hypothetical protein